MTTETPTTPTEPTPIDAAHLTARTICLALRRGKFGNRRKANTGAITVESDKTLLSLSKQLLDSPELQAIGKLDSEVQGHLTDLCLPSMFRGGIWLLPLGLVEEVDAFLRDKQAAREALVNAAVTAYGQRMQETAARLDVLYDPRDYPSVERFQQCFYFEWQYITFDTPARLKAINPELFAIEREKAALKLQQVAEECQNAMRAGMASLVGKMVERLTPDADGKPKRFHKSLVGNFQEFLRTFEMRNITDDSELTRLVTQARHLLQGVDPDTLRSDEAIRNAVQTGFEQIQASLAPMVQTVTRAIDLDDE